MELAIPDQAWPVVLLVAVVILALLIALVLLLITLWSRGRSRLAPQPGTDVEDSESSDGKSLVGARPLWRGPEGQASERSLKLPSEEKATLPWVPAAVGDSPSDEGERPRAELGSSEPIGAADDPSPSVEGGARESGSTPGPENEVELKPPAYQSASELLVQRLQQRPALAIGVVLVAAWLLRSIFRRR
jgi:hypothetical protein